MVADHLIWTRFALTDMTGWVTSVPASSDGIAIVIANQRWCSQTVHYRRQGIHVGSIWLVLAESGSQDNRGSQAIVGNAQSAANLRQLSHDTKRRNAYVFS